MFSLCLNFRYKLNVWDVGGQKSLRSYWRNYFECTDGLIWVVDSADKRRLLDCKRELHQLLDEEVTLPFVNLRVLLDLFFKDLGTFSLYSQFDDPTKLLFQRLSGATLLVFANKQDLPGALSFEEIRDVSTFILYETSVVMSI